MIIVVVIHGPARLESRDGDVVREARVVAVAAKWRHFVKVQSGGE